MKQLLKKIGEGFIGGPAIYLVTGENEYCQRAIRKLGYNEGDLSAAIGRNLGTTFLCGGKKVIAIVFTKKPSDGTIIHEAVHAAFFILQFAGVDGIRTDEESCEEILAGIVEGIFSEVKREIYAK